MKKPLLLFTLLVSSLITFAQVPTNGLIASFPFNGNSGDVSGNNHDGTVSGATLTTDRYGNANSAYRFTSASQNITISSLHLTNVVQYSVAAWFKKDSTTLSVNHEGTIFCGNFPGGSSPVGLRLFVGSTNQVVWINEFSGGCMGLITTNQNYADNKWHSVVATLNSASGIITSSQMKIYVDNILVSQTQYSQGNVNSAIAPISNTLPIVIGNVNGNGDYFQGSLDDVRIYNKPLTSNEITALYNEGICFQNVTVTDTLIVKMNITGYNPLSYNNTIKIYPNPTAGKLNIDISNYNNISDYSVKLIDNLGSVKFQNVINSNNFIIDISTYAGGIYHFIVTDKSGNLIERKNIVLQK